MMNSISCTDDQISISSIDETFISTTPVTTTVVPQPAEIMIMSQQQLRRVGSGASVVLDAAVDAAQSSRINNKLPSSRFKGVVPQPNGRWGAQIYEKHQRVWLGTFNDEHEAAKAYDIAVQRFRGREAVTNFKQSVENKEAAAMEASFLNSHSKSEIVDMLRKHTYNEELHQSKLRRFISSSSFFLHDKLTTSSDDDNIIKRPPRQHLFQKTLTPSDVGKLNRLVIPKQHAEKHFPVQKGTSSSCKGVLLHFEDIKDSKVWRFRYSYWNSSQSYVLTKGWSRFVKEKNLNAGDSVSFESSTGPVDDDVNNKQLYINWKSKTTPAVAVAAANAVVKQLNVEPVQMLRLFGVNIDSSVSNSSSSCCNGKRSISTNITEMDLLGFQSSCKKQRIINVL